MPSEGVGPLRPLPITSRSVALGVRGERRTGGGAILPSGETYFGTDASSEVTYVEGLVRGQVAVYARQGSSGVQVRCETSRVPIARDITGRGRVRSRSVGLRVAVRLLT